VTPAQPNDRRTGRNDPVTAGGLENLVPPPRAPLFDSLRRLVPKARRSEPIDLDAIFEELVEIAVWTSHDGDWQEYASFLLHTSDGSWHAVGFGDPAAGELTARLQRLPGCDTALLLDLIGERTRRIVTLWSHPYRRARS
jgi:hypothetical protein